MVWLARSLPENSTLPLQLQVLASRHAQHSKAELAEVWQGSTQQQREQAPRRACRPLTSTSSCASTSSPASARASSISAASSSKRTAPSGTSSSSLLESSAGRAAGSTCCVVARLAPRCIGAAPPVLCPLASMKAGTHATHAVARVGPGSAQAPGSSS